MIVLVVKHQEFQAKIRNVKALLDEKNNQLSNLSTTLEHVHSDLLGAIHDTSVTTKSLSTKSNLTLIFLTLYRGG
jgi:hypothetical protein